MDIQQVLYLAILSAAFSLLLTERLRGDLVVVLAALALAVTGILKPEEALGGFASEPALVVAGVLVLSGGVRQTGLSDLLGQAIGRIAGHGYTRMIAIIVPAVASLSAFTHHLTTTAVMLPVTLDLARDHRIAPSKLLMPLSFAASLGTTITVIGAPAFLIARATLEEAGRPGLSLFSIAPIGIALSIAGTVYALTLGRWLLPDRSGTGLDGDRFRLGDYLTEVAVLADSPLIGKAIPDLEAAGERNLSVVGRLRGGRRLPAQGIAGPIEAGDVLIVNTSPEQLLAFREAGGVELHPVHKYGAPAANGHAGSDAEASDQIVQAVVAPGSELIGRTIREVDIRRRHGAIAIGLWRRHGWLRQELAKVQLRAGDVLVLQGDAEALGRVETDRAFLMLVPFHAEARRRGKAPIAAAIVVATVLLAAFNLLSIEIAALAGAAALVLTGCLTGRQAYRSIDPRLFVFIAGAIPLGLGMQRSGVAGLLAEHLVGALETWPRIAILLAVFSVVAIVTQFLSDAATTALFAPIAIALAGALGQPPEPYVVTVAMAAVASFLTPIGHHGNLLVYGPGGYRFADFIRVGAPLTVIVAILVVLIAPRLWPG